MPSSASDTTAAPWGENMGGRLLASVEQSVAKRKTTNVTISLDAAAQQAIRKDGSLVMSFQSESGSVNAWYFIVK